MCCRKRGTRLQYCRDSRGPSRSLPLSLCLSLSVFLWGVCSCLGATQRRSVKTLWIPRLRNVSKKPYEVRSSGAAHDPCWLILCAVFAEWRLRWRCYSGQQGQSHRLSKKKLQTQWCDARPKQTHKAAREKCCNHMDKAEPKPYKPTKQMQNKNVAKTKTLQIYSTTKQVTVLAGHYSTCC